MKEVGSDLLVTLESPEEFIPKLMEEGAHNIIAYHADGITKESKEVEQNLQAALKFEKLKRELAWSSASSDEEQGDLSYSMMSFWGTTLHHIEDLTYDPTTSFK